MSAFKVLFDGHDLVIGSSGAGKGAFVAGVARRWRADGGVVYLLTKKRDEYAKFEADFKTMDQKRFLAAVEACNAPADGYVNVLAIIDEAWAWNWKNETYGLQMVANAARSYGVKMIVQSQFPTQMAPTVRGNCDNLYAFRLKEPRAIKWAEDFCGKEFADCKNIPPGRFICQRGLEPSFRGTAWYRDATGKWFGV